MRDGDQFANAILHFGIASKALSRGQRCAVGVPNFSDGDGMSWSTARATDSGAPVGWTWQAVYLGELSMRDG